MADQMVLLTLFQDTDNIFHVQCSPKNLIALVGDRLRFASTDNLPFRVVFEGSPFAARPIEITDGNPRVLATEGRFFYKCFLTLTAGPNAGTEVGWFAGEVPESGGEVDVRP